MKIYSNKYSKGQYIGGKLFDMPDEYWEDYEAQETRAEGQNDYIYDYSDNYIIYWNNGEEVSFTSDLDISWDITDKMAIKDGIDVIAYDDHIDVIGYYNGREDVAHLYPISDDMADELIETIDNSDFDDTTTIGLIIAQYAWGGASDIDIIKSWR